VHVFNFFALSLWTAVFVASSERQLYDVILCK